MFFKKYNHFGGFLIFLDLWLDTFHWFCKILSHYLLKIDLLSLFSPGISITCILDYLYCFRCFELFMVVIIIIVLLPSLLLFLLFSLLQIQKVWFTSRRQVPSIWHCCQGEVALPKALGSVRREWQRQRGLLTALLDTVSRSNLSVFYFLSLLVLLVSYLRIHWNFNVMKTYLCFLLRAQSFSSYI